MKKILILVFLMFSLVSNGALAAVLAEKASPKGYKFTLLRENQRNEKINFSDASVLQVGWLEKEFETRYLAVAVYSYNEKIFITIMSREIVSGSGRKNRIIPNDFVKYLNAGFGREDLDIEISEKSFAATGDIRLELKNINPGFRGEIFAGDGGKVIIYNISEKPIPQEREGWITLRISSNKK